MSDENEISLDVLAQMIAEGFNEASEDRAVMRAVLGAMQDELDEHTKLLQQLVKFDQLEDRLRVIDTHLGIDSRKTAPQK